MKRALSAILSLAISLAQGHYTFPDLIVNGTITSDWEYVRITANHYSNGPLTNVSDPEFRCYELDLVNTASETGTATVVAGSTIGFKADNTMGHPGYFDVYMTPAVPAANSEAAGTGKTWFKIWEWAPTWSASTGLVFASENIQSFNFTIPKNLPSGQYLVRGEASHYYIQETQLSLSAETYGGAQFYIGCAQVNVINGGSGTPGPLTSFPGAYTGYEPGILINIYDLPANYTGYTSPGTAVWTG